MRSPASTWTSAWAVRGRRTPPAVAERLGIPFETADIRAELEREVCAPFAADYRAGRTPLPCARCNPAVKFPALFALAGRIGARYVSTGHYARVENGVLKKGCPPTTSPICWPG